MEPQPRLRRTLITMSTNVVRPADPTLRDALRLAALFAAVKFLVHVAANLYQAHIGWGYFRDEFYYIACGRHLAWGYVDHGPLVALQARAAETLFGHSLAGIRVFSALAGAARVFLTGLLAWALGGRRPAQGLAMIGVLLCPMYLGVDSVLAMNSFESLFWMTALLSLMLIARGGSDRLWLLFGLAAGLGLLNKPSMAFFLAALLIAMLLSPQRRLLATRYAPAGIALMLLIVLPYILWQAHNHWPTWEFLQNGRAENKNIALSPGAFLLQQLLTLGPLTAVVWLPGLVWLLRRPAYRWLGLTFLLFLALMASLHAKDYYVSPIYPILFAAGGVFWEARLAHRGAVREDRAFAFPIYQATLAVTTLFILPLVFPVLTPANWLAYTRATGLAHLNSNSENSPSGPLPQFYADRFGWQEEVDQVTRVYNALPPERRRVTGIACDNYGEAGALNFLGQGLPTAISGQNNFWLWGYNGYSYDSMILIERSTPEHLREYFDTVEVVGHTGTPFSMPFEHKTIYLVHGRKFDPAVIWPKKKFYI